MNENDMQHGRYYAGQNISGYVSTEKYNGCRAYWDGEYLWSRGGLKISIPIAWRDSLPSGIHLDSELYDGVDGLSRCVSAVRYGHFTDTMRLMVFDCPSFAGNYLQRLSYARQYAHGPIFVVDATVVSGMAHVIILLADVFSHHGEGLILRAPGLQYEASRTSQILKLKSIPTDKPKTKRERQQRERSFCPGSCCIVEGLWGEA